jgi:serine/threonine protein kinase
VIGTRIGFYEITSQLGQGGMGAVYLAVHHRIGHRKVVKVLLPEHSRDEALVRRFETEAKAAARLNHRNITKLDDFNRLPSGEWFIMMPFLDGSTLDALLAETGPVSLHQALRILGQICAALHAAHGAGIVHRDLKPANIFISATEDNPQHVTLLDFGIAKISSEADGRATQTGTSFGTPLYMAAEQFVDSSRADERSDIFALGVIAYQMLTGEFPFGRGSSAVLYTKQHEGRPAMPSQVPRAWAEVILKALSLDPRERQQSAHAFAVALAAATPEAPPVPDGVQILRDVAKELVVYAPPNGNTVPARSSASFEAVPLLSAMERGGGELAPDVTTLSAFRGQRASPPQRSGTSKKGRWRLAALGGSVAVGSGSLIVAVMQLSSPNIEPRAVGSVDARPAAPSSQPEESQPVVPKPAARVTLVIEAEPKDADIFINGHAAAKPSVPREFDVGTKLQIRAAKRGYISQERSVIVDPTLQKVSLSLQRARSVSPKVSKPASDAAPPRRVKFDPEGAGGT